MTKIIYDGADHASGRLRETVIQYQGEPCYVVRVHEGIEIEAKLLRGGDNFLRPLEDFDLEPVTLGNIQTGEVFQYITRVPERRWKQGLTRGAIAISPNKIWGERDVKLYSQEMRSCIRGTHHTFDKAYTLVADKRELLGTTFSRSLGLGRNKKGQITLIHRGKEVGLVDDNVFIDKKFFFLKELILEDLNKVA